MFLIVAVYQLKFAILNLMKKVIDMKLTSAAYKNIIFPIIFFVKRLDVNSKINNINKMDERKFSDISEIQRQKYKKLLDIACTNTSYYKTFIGSSYDLKSDIACITSMPILTKEVLQRNDLTTNRRNCIVRMTAGTTGSPVTVCVDKNALSWQLATRYFLFGLHGISIGDREARFWGRPLKGIRYKLKDYLLNRKRFCFCGLIKDELIHEYMTLLNYEPDYFYGYSSLILNAAILCDENSLKVPKLKAIICTAELLGKQQKKYIERVFGCPVIVEYGCTESDIIAFECEYGKLHIMSHNIFIENNPNSGGVVYTDLNNSATPLIRYELGDNVVIDNNCNCDCNRALPVITHLEGRTIGQILTLPDGTTMHAVKFAYLIEDIANKGYDIIQFKIVSENNQLVIYVNINGDSEKFEKEMRHGLDNILHDKMSYTIKYGVISTEMNKKFTYFEQKDSPIINLQSNKH